MLKINLQTLGVLLFWSQCLVVRGGTATLRTSWMSFTPEAEWLPTGADLMGSLGSNDSLFHLDARKCQFKRTFIFLFLPVPQMRSAVLNIFPAGHVFDVKTINK